MNVRNASLIIAEKQKQAKSPSNDKIWYMHKLDYLPMKRNNIQIHATCMHFENIMLSERSQTLKRPYIV